MSGRAPQTSIAPKFSTQQRQAAHDHAAYQAQERPGHTGDVPMPKGKYPVTLAEACNAVEALTERVTELEQRVKGLCAVERERWEIRRGLNPGQAAWEQVAGACDGPMARGVE